MTALYDHKGKTANYDLHSSDGLTSKLGGAMSKAADPTATRKLLEDTLRPFVVANKSKFPDLPDRAFKTSVDDSGHTQPGNGLHRSINVTFEAPK